MQERGFLHHLFLQGVEDERGRFVASYRPVCLEKVWFRSMHIGHRTSQELIRDQSMFLPSPPLLFLQ